MSTDEVVIGLISAPGPATDIAAAVADHLRAELTSHVPTVRWRVPTVVDALVLPPSDDAALVSAARERLLKEGWDLVVCLTDLPLKVHRRPVVAHASPLHGVAVVCLPALGAIGLHKRSRETVVCIAEVPPRGPGGALLPVGDRRKAPRGLSGEPSCRG